MSGVLDVSAADWEKEVLKANTIVLVDFWHENCPWCIRLDPVFSEVAEEYEGKVKFTKINVLDSDENREIAFKYGIMGTHPSFLL